MASSFKFESQGAQGHAGAQGQAGAPGQTGAQGPNGQTGAQGPNGVLGVGKSGTGGFTGLVAPQQYDANMRQVALTRNTIGLGNDDTNETYLPGGNWQLGTSDNHLPNGVDKFNFLEVIADMNPVSGGANKTVYVPCYWSRT